MDGLAHLITYTLWTEVYCDIISFNSILKNNIKTKEKKVQMSQWLLIINNIEYNVCE